MSCAFPAVFDRDHFIICQVIDPPSNEAGSTRHNDGHSGRSETYFDMAHTSDLGRGLC